MRRLPSVIFVVFILELASLVWLGSHIGVLPVLAITILDVMIGSALIRKSGTNIFTVMRAQNADAKAVSSGAVNGIFDAIAGVFFIIPGLFSDGLALVLLMPWLRRRLAGLIEPRIIVGRHRGPHGPIIDAKAVEIEESVLPGPRPAQD